METDLALSVVRTATTRTKTATSRSAGEAAVAAGARLRSIQSRAIQRGGRVVEGRVSVLTSVRGGQTVANGALVRSVHQYRTKIERTQRPEAKPGEGGIDLRA